MKKLIIALLAGFLLFGCTTVSRHGLEGKKCPYVIRQNQFYNQFIVGDNQVIRSYSNAMKIEYSVTEKAGGYLISGKFYSDPPANGVIGVGIMDSNWTVQAHIASSYAAGYSSPQTGRDFSMYVNPAMYDISKFNYIAFGQSTN